MLELNIIYPVIKSVPKEEVPINPYFNGTLKWPEMKLWYSDFKKKK